MVEEIWSVWIGKYLLYIYTCIKKWITENKFSSLGNRKQQLWHNFLHEFLQKGGEIHINGGMQRTILVKHENKSKKEDTRLNILLAKTKLKFATFLWPSYVIDYICTYR